MEKEKNNKNKKRIKAVDVNKLADGGLTVDLM